MEGDCLAVELMELGEGEGVELGGWDGHGWGVLVEEVAEGGDAGGLGF